VPVLTTGPVIMGQTTKTNLELEEGLRAGLATATEHHIQSSASDAIHRNTPVQPDELPRLIARQLADISQRTPDRPVEVALNPEELGRVRMSISAHESGITMALLVERPETLGLMRRHIDQLTQEFHALGFEDVRFLFSQNSKSDGSGSDPMKQNPSAHSEDPAAEAAIQLSLSPSVGLDMRL
jgi:flagellar hook-length control protein FliK